MSRQWYSVVQLLRKHATILDQVHLSGAQLGVAAWACEPSEVTKALVPVSNSAM